MSDKLRAQELFVKLNWWWFLWLYFAYGFHQVLIRWLAYTFVIATSLSSQSLVVGLSLRASVDVVAWDNPTLWDFRYSSLVTDFLLASGKIARSFRVIHQNAMPKQCHVTALMAEEGVSCCVVTLNPQSHFWLTAFVIDSVSSYSTKSPYDIRTKFRHVSDKKTQTKTSAQWNIEADTGVLSTDASNESLDLCR